MIDFLLDILKIESTTGNEAEVTQFIAERYAPKGCVIEIQEAEPGRPNVFFKVGESKIVLCSHTDTVPPYISPRIENDIIYGRGSCDAKGQLAYLWQATNELIAEGNNNFGLLMVCGEEVGSTGARHANKTLTDTDYLIIGEPTENKLVLATKGTQRVEVTIRGRSCHSGYPAHGDNAINRMRKFFERLDAAGFPDDEVMGKTTYNVGNLKSDNAQNVVSDLVTFSLFFRTTFASNEMFKEILEKIKDENTSYEYPFGKGPLRFYTLDGFETDVVSFGTDAPSFTNVKNKLLYGPGTILAAHTENEHIKIKDLYRAVEDVKVIFKKISKGN